VSAPAGAGTRAGRAGGARAPRTDRRLTRETRAARVHVGLAGALGVVTAALVVAQAALLALIVARAAERHVTLAALRTPLLALAAVLTARALIAGGFELSGRLGALRVMSELRGRLAGALLVSRPGRKPAERTGQLAAPASGNPGIGKLIVAVVILGVVVSWMGTWLWNLASSRLSPVLAGLLVNVETIAGFAYVYAAKLQWPPPGQLAGLLLVITGVALAVRRQQPGPGYPVWCDDAR
jgi:drug/metabolite transporter (DMT)-like permease